MDECLLFFSDKYGVILSLGAYRTEASWQCVASFQIAEPDTVVLLARA